MAFRNQAIIGLMFAALLPAAELTYSVRHDHLRKSGESTLVVSDSKVEFREAGKHAAHSRAWPLEEIQRLELLPGQVRITSYEDNRRELGRDREYRFDGLPKDAAEAIYALLAPRMDQRLVARVAVNEPAPVWTMPGKMLNGRYGSNGVLRVGARQIVFASTAGSRTWRIQDVENVTSEGPFELTVSSLHGDTRIQLKERLEEERFSALWRRVAEANGLKVYHASLGSSHD